MSPKIDTALLAGFVAEARGYLPAIHSGLDLAIEGDPSQLSEVHRFVHTIKGAASMVGLAPLGHFAYYIEDALDSLGDGRLEPTRDRLVALRKTAELLGRFLDDHLASEVRAREIAVEAVGLLRAMDLPIADEAAAIERLAAVEEGPGAGATMPESLAFRGQPDSTPSGSRREEWEGAEANELVETFRIEAQDYFQSLSVLLSDLGESPERRDLFPEMRRVVHTLKGSAGLVGFATVGRVAHRMEDLLDLVTTGEAPVSPEVHALLVESVDFLQDALEEAPEHEAFRQQADRLFARYRRELERTDSIEPSAAEANFEPPIVDLLSGLDPLGARPAQEHREASETGSDVEPDGGIATAPERGSVATRRLQRSGETLRVPLERLDDVVKLIGEFVIGRSSFEQQFLQLVRNVEELEPGVARLRRIASRLEREYEVAALSGTGALVGTVADGSAVSPSPRFAEGFDALEFDRYTEFHLLSRELTEATSDIAAIGNRFRDAIGDFDSYLARLGRLTGDVQDKMMRLRMVPLSTLATRLHRAVRVTAGRQGKLVDLHLIGQEVALDKTVLEELVDPLMHALRNAVDHGIEPPALRQALGKPERGRIEIRAGYEGTQVVVAIRDDGAGLEPELLKASAIALGIASQAEVEAMPLTQLQQLVFVHGFSTAHEVSEISGRGVGMDVVRSTVSRLKGSVGIQSTAGSGTEIVIRLPLTLAISRVLLVRSWGETFALPLSAISKIERIDRSELTEIGREQLLRADGETYPFYSLGSLLGLQGASEADHRRVPVLVVQAGDKKVALQVDRLEGARDAVVKTLGSHLKQVWGITGATLLGDGTVVLILNPNELFSETTPRRAAESVMVAQRVATARQWVVMVVDDSLSVRTILSNLIRSSGWTPVAAKDGVEALETLQRLPRLPDAILLDIEMPRMDGYEFAATLKNQDAYRSIPILMLTSRAGAKHRQRAMEIGVDRYFVKPYQEEDLREAIRSLAGREGIGDSQ